MRFGVLVLTMWKKKKKTLKMQVFAYVVLECFGVLFILLDTKTSKCTRITLVVETIRQYQKGIFWVFLCVLGIKTLKSMESTRYGCFPIWKKTFLLNVFSAFYAKNVYKTPFMKKHNIITKKKKKSILNVFKLLGTKTPNSYKLLYMSKRKDITINAYHHCFWAS